MEMQLLYNANLLLLIFIAAAILAPGGNFYTVTPNTPRMSAAE